MTSDLAGYDVPFYVIAGLTGNLQNFNIAADSGEITIASPRLMCL